MMQQVKYALLVAAVVCIAALIYVKLPGFPGGGESATTGAATTTGTATTAPQASLSSPSIQKKEASSTVELGGQVVRVTVVDTPQAREQGLSGRTGLAPDEGMLFIFPAPGAYGFWMKDMLFPIDMVWISGSGVVVDLRESVPPDSYPTIFTPEAPARYVLELPAGFTKMYTVRKGDRVRL